MPCMMEGGAGSVRVAPGGAEEFDALARHFNDMMARIEHFNEEVSQRIAEATCELASRFDEVQRLNELLYRTRNKLSQSERLAVAGQMVAQVAHEVGTPLHSMAGHLELLRAELTKQPDNGAAIHRMPPHTHTRTAVVVVWAPQRRECRVPTTHHRPLRRGMRCGVCGRGCRPLASVRAAKPHTLAHMFRCDAQCGGRAA